MKTFLKRLLLIKGLFIKVFEGKDVEKDNVLKL